MMSGVATERLTISLDTALAGAVSEAAAQDEQNMSAWLAEAARRRLVSRGLRDVVSDWEAEHGAFTEEELARARAELGH